MAVALACTPALAETDAQKIMGQTCAACHTAEPDGNWSRISHQRKTPEGWLMSIARMQVMHGLQISDEDRRTLVKYLADRQGLAPSETAGARYALERRLNTMESFESEAFTQTCARCHSGARVALQRRPAAEWEHLVHFHLGQWPTTEYQALGRDRDWLNLALDTMVPELADTYGLESDAWTQWQASAKADPAGQWRLIGQIPGRGEMNATLSARRSGDDLYSLELVGQYADGTALSGSGQAIVYTGYEWRGEIEVDGVAMRQVFALDGDRISGRMFETEHDEVGFDIRGARLQADSTQLLAVQPGYLKAGSSADITLVGAGLAGDIVLGEGVTIDEVLQRTEDTIRLRVSAAQDATGLREVRVGDSEPVSFSLYDSIARIRVLPEYSVSRIGGNGSSTPRVYGLFDAEAWAAGTDGIANTDDDYRIGIVPASWSVEPFDERAAEDEDTRFAGVIDAVTGRFTPGAAGPNPERRMSTNNAGNLKVVASVEEDGQSLSGSAQMIVTVQRWNNPPIP
ncbi:quinohemoprotein amine dehydrogenase subunit alpha [Marinobacterium aestuarii]|uniref:Quinohemoprotein amine dehydrogenase subunit alpha n=2 Tax=Marinobacterium aestuarii TaxID=1821621 RepID=A0A1A9F564_9GAMM|nr:quinohemoprotein amine dehydrogenase subunit alpha [Marinobacterium aestuarii]